MNTNKWFAFLVLKSRDVLYQNILLYFMYISSDAVNTDTFKSFCFNLNKLFMETFSEIEDKGTCLIFLWGRSVLFQRKMTTGFRTPDSKDQNHRNAVCRGFLEVSPTKILLLLASTSSGKTYLSATLPRKHKNISVLYNLSGKIRTFCISPSSSCRLPGC